MTVNATELVRFRQFRGYEDPSLPLLYWAATVSVVGDGSGGQRQLSMIFNPSTAPRPPLFYSLEQLTIFDSDNNAKAGVLEAINLDDVGGITMIMTRVMPLVAGLTQSGPTVVDLEAIQGYYIGGAVDAGTETRLGFRSTNVTGTVLVANAQGYAWGPRSILAPGGLQRPVQGLYSR